MRALTGLLVVVTATSVIADGVGPYRVLHTYKLGGDGSWDYLVPGPPGHRLFIGRQSRMMVVDEESGTRRPDADDAERVAQHGA